MQLLPPMPATELLGGLLRLREDICREGEEICEEWRPYIQRRAFYLSSMNFAHYLAMRRRDLRAIQAQLAPLGLSTLGRSEAHVLPNLDAVIAALGAICQRPPEQLPARPSARAFYRGDRFLARSAAVVLGPAPQPRRIRIMVTLPSEAATDHALVLDLAKRGMDWARINCAHDDADIWGQMLANIHKAEKETGRACKVLMDLGGPKARTGEVIAPKKKRVCKDDLIRLTRDEPHESKDFEFQAECLLPDVFEQLHVGAEVWIDDGSIGTQVESVSKEAVVLRVCQVAPKGGKLKTGKGLNFPGTDIQVAPLTAKDRADLQFVTSGADAVGYSFVQSAEDVEMLQDALGEHLKAQPGRAPLAVIAKIETAKAVRNLPEIIVRAAGRQPFGVMIARGDLAVEIGYQRMAEMQEEILWLCEAAHVPVIWATQVLETFVRKGIPSRAEMTDAAMSERAECVMLNKGPFIAEAVSILDDVLTRMQAHQSKKTPQLRALQSWQDPA